MAHMADGHSSPAFFASLPLPPIASPAPVGVLVIRSPSPPVVQFSRANINAAPIRHPKFYLEDGNIIFLVDNVLFKVHRYFFATHSEVFRGMFSVPGPPEQPPDGESDEHPIHLDDSTSRDFECFLEVVYGVLGKKVDRSTQEWSSIAVFAHKYMFCDLQETAIREVTERTDDPVAQVFLGRRINDDALLRAGYLGFARRTEFITPADAARIGLAETVNLTKFRELARMCKNGRVTYKEPIDDLLAPTGLQWYNMDQLLDECLPYYHRLEGTN